MPTIQLRDPRHYLLHAEICKVLTEPKRLMLLDALAAGEASVGELAATIGIGLPNASQHLAVMRGAGLVETSRTGTSVRYRLSEPAIVEACRLIDRIIDARQIRGSTAPAPVPSTTSHPATASRADQHARRS